MSLEVIIGLIVGGVLMLLAEVFVPGGVVGVLGVVMMATGIVGGFQHSATLGFGLLAGSLVFGLLAFWAWARFFPHTAVGRRMILSQDASQWQGFDPGHQSLLGREGVAHTPLRPAGTGLIGGRRVDVVTRGEMIESGRPLRVIQVEGNRVVVAEVGQGTTATPAAS